MSDTCRLVEQYIIKKKSEYFEMIDAAAFAAKNLYNLVNYHIRQAYLHEHRYMQMKELYALVKGTDAYIALPRKVSNQVIWNVYHNWGAYYEAIKAWRDQPESFLGKPSIPKYKDKQDGRSLLVYEKGAVNKRYLNKCGFVTPSGLNIPIYTRQSSIDQIRIVPRKNHYIIEIVYTVAIQPDPTLNNQFVAGIDIGVNNLAALSSNKPGFRPLLVNGKPLKAINQYYNKRKAELQSLLSYENANRHSSNRINRMGEKRNRQINQYLHTASRRIVNLLIEEKIGVLVIGKNKDWKQNANMSRANNQNFVQIPFARFIDMLTYKAQLAGMVVVEQEESYTSKCSFLDRETIGKQASYAGKRKQRGLFVSASGKTINADLNGSYNIIRKAIPNAFCNGIEGVAVHPSGFVL